MNMYDTLFSPTSRLNEQVARQVFETLPEGGPVMLIAERDGNCWPSDSQAMIDLQIDESSLVELWNKIDDGDEPVITHLNGCVVAAAQLTTERTKCGYIAIFLPKHQPESALVNTDLLEIAINQINLVAKLIEKNTKLYEMQMRHQPGTGDYIFSQIAAN